LFYYVSHAAGGEARIEFIAQVGSNTVTSTTGRMITTGGTTRQLVFINPPASETAGKTFLNLPPFTLERRDDFNNPTTVSNVNVVLDDTANSQVAVHSGRGFSPGNHDFEFETLSGVPISGLTFLGGQSDQSFVYFDKMASTPLEDGRTGTWALQTYVGSSFTNSTVQAQDNLIVNPDATAKMAFHNPVRTLQAGLPFNPSGNLSLSNLQVEMQDINGNPTPAVAPVTVQLAAYRVASSSYDAYGFSASSGILPPPPPQAPGFAAPTTTLQINAAQWGTTFYYFDTRASENYNVPAASPTISAWVDGVNWSTGTQSVAIVPGSIYQLGMLAAPSALIAGATSQTFEFATQDIYGNPTPITIGDFGGPSASFQLTSDSSGT